MDNQDRPDLLRTADKTALIGDKRNDENKIVSQIHALFLKFHNKVFDDLGRFSSQREPSRFGNDHNRFLEAQRIVRWCYQWIVLNDYLPKICRKDIVKQIMPSEEEWTPHFKFYDAKSGQAFMPVEFSVAAFRFGHSMVRPSYSLNDTTIQSDTTPEFTLEDGRKGKFARIPIFVAQSRNDTDSLSGFGEPLPPRMGHRLEVLFRREAPGKERGKTGASTQLPH